MKHDNYTLLKQCFSKKELKTFSKYKKDSKRIVFNKNNKILGEVWITPSTKLEYIPQITTNGYYVSNLCVDHSYREEGIATKLMNHVISLAKRENKLHLILQSTPKYLVDFYISLGFHIYLSGYNKEGVLINIMLLGL
jgi:ribosomal protein S18 acetylase RimI-like enzyme